MVLILLLRLTSRVGGQPASLCLCRWQNSGGDGGAYAHDAFGLAQLAPSGLPPPPHLSLIGLLRIGIFEPCGRQHELKAAWPLQRRRACIQPARPGCEIRGIPHPLPLRR